MSDRPGEEASAPAASDSPAAAPVGGMLLPRVQELLTRIFEKGEREKYQRFFSTGGGALEGLGALDLAAAEQEGNWGEEGQIWDALPQEVRAALDGVEGFLVYAAEAFPSDDAPDDAEFDFDLGPSDQVAQPSGEQAPDSLAKSLRAFVLNLGHELRVLRESLGQPVAGEDPWNVFERIGEFRGRTRAGIGEMVFLAAREFAVIRKEDVVPFYKEDVNTSIALRAAITNLRARIDVYRARLEHGLQREERPGVQATISGLHDLFDAFMGTEPYRSLRVVDRRSCIDLRQSLADLRDQEKPPRRAVEMAVEGLTKFLESLTLVNQRELLVVHDRQAIADTEPHLHSIEQAVADDDAKAARDGLTRVLRTAMPLFGREPTFDVLINLLRHVDPAKLSMDDLLALARLMRKQL